MKLLTFKEVAAKLQVKVSWVYEHTRDRCPDDQKIPSIQLPGGRYRRFREDEIDDWLKRGCKPRKLPETDEDPDK